MKSFAEATSAGELAEAHTAWLGRKSELKVGLRNVRDRETGMALNAVRERLEGAFATREAELERGALAELDQQPRRAQSEAAPLEARDDLSRERAPNRIGLRENQRLLDRHRRRSLVPLPVMLPRFWRAKSKR